MGRNLSAGRMMNFSFAKNFAITTPTTSSGASAFFRRVHQLWRDGWAASVSITLLSGSPFISQPPSFLSCPVEQSCYKSKYYRGTKGVLHFIRMNKKQSERRI